MAVTIQFFGVAGYKIITSNGIHVVIDPFLDSNPNCPVKVKAEGILSETQLRSRRQTLAKGLHKLRARTAAAPDEARPRGNQLG